ncbi:MAG: 1,4-dihydroxy-2-naphthoate octaprenyltransferase [bacterium]|nr:1,4-dihydroxy-2-naphthoate octaprenyltransferase [bacterium]
MFPAWLGYAWLAIRPKTLTMALAPLLAATALAWSETGEVKPVLILMTAVAALLVQIGTNLHNDAADFERGTDTEDRVGPRRAAAEGWFSARQLKITALSCFALCWIPVAYLIWVGGWPILVAGILSMLAGYGYTAGPCPISTTPLGELTVFLFFGLVATVSFHYVQTLHIAATALGLGAALGLHAAAVLLVNNYRDLEVDRASGRFTLVHFLGRARVRWLYAGMVLMPFLLPLWMPGHTAMVLLLLPPALFLTRRLFVEPVGSNLNSLLAATAGLQFLFCILASIALVLET